MFTLSLINPTTETPFFTRPTRNAVWSTTRAGEERLRAIIDDVSLSDAVVLFDKATFAFVRISKDAEIAWQGVVTDVQLTYDNNRYALVVNAAGYSLLFRNKHVTGLFSLADGSKFFLLNNQQFGNSINDSRIRFDTAEYVLITFRAGSTFPANSRISFAYRCPNGSDYAINLVEFSFLASDTTPFLNQLYAGNPVDYGFVGSLYQTSFSSVSGTYNMISLPSPYEIIIFSFVTPTTFTVPAYDISFAFSPIRLLTAYPPINPSKILNLLGINVINNASIQSDLLNVVFEDQTTAELFDIICRQDNLEYSILAPNVVELRTLNETNYREKYRIIAETLNISRDATTIANNVYARYRDSIKTGTRRTTRADNAIARDVFANGVFRDTFIDVDTYNRYTAETARNRALEALRSGSMRLRATTRNVATASQSPVPNWKVRAGAIAGIVNLGRVGYGQVSEVIIDRTDYDAATDTLTIESQIDAL